MAEFSFVTTLFNWLNFAALIALGVYLFKRYLLPSYLETIRQQERTGSTTEARHKTLTHQHSNALRSLQQQKQLIGYLQERIMRWQTQVAAQEKKAQEKQLIHFKKIKEKRLVQEVNRSEQVRLAQALPKAFAHAEHTLTALYAQPKAQHTYIESVLHSLRHSDDRNH
jgi:hypothetical protein